jgi:hypothetical protein
MSPTIRAPAFTIVRACDDVLNPFGRTILAHSLFIDGRHTPTDTRYPSRTVAPICPSSASNRVTDLEDEFIKTFPLREA